MPDRLLTASEVANYLAVPLSTLYQWNSKGIGPRYVRIGRHARWTEADLLAWVQRQYHDNPKSVA